MLVGVSVCGPTEQQRKQQFGVAVHWAFCVCVNEYVCVSVMRVGTGEKDLLNSVKLLFQGFLAAFD